MDLKNKIVLAHRGYFDRKSVKLYPENSVEVCTITDKKDYIDIIELDIRKSKDGVLYCHHGGFFQYYFSLKIPRVFSDIKKKYHVDTLQDILNVISSDKMIVLDIKSRSITREDILQVLGGKKFKQVILGNTSVSSVYFLERFNNMPEGFVKVMNGNIFCTFFDLQKLKDKNFKYFEVVFPFQVSRKLIDDVSRHGMEFRCAGLFFRNGKSYWDTINKYGIKHVSSDFI